MVLVQAAARPDGPAGRCLLSVFEGRVQLHVSRVTLRELRAVLAYPTVRSRFPTLTLAACDALIEKVRWRAVYHRKVPHAIDLPRDPKDEPYLNLAVHAGCDMLTTRDRDLLDLAGGRDATAKRLRQLAPQLKIVTPEALLQSLPTDPT